MNTCDGWDTKNTHLSDLPAPFAKSRQTVNILSMDFLIWLNWNFKVWIAIYTTKFQSWDFGKIHSNRCDGWDRLLWRVRRVTNLVILPSLKPTLIVMKRIYWNYAYIIIRNKLFVSDINQINQTNSKGVIRKNLLKKYNFFGAFFFHYIWKFNNILCRKPIFMYYWLWNLSSPLKF